MLNGYVSHHLLPSITLPVLFLSLPPSPLSLSLSLSLSFFLSFCHLSVFLHYYSNSSADVILQWVFWHILLKSGFWQVWGWHASPVPTITGLHHSGGRYEHAVGKVGKTTQVTAGWFSAELTWLRLSCSLHSVTAWHDRYFAYNLCGRLGWKIPLLYNSNRRDSLAYQSCNGPIKFQQPIPQWIGPPFVEGHSPCHVLSHATSIMVFSRRPQQ